ncbi:MAG: hypothetical protein ABIT76_00030 [Chthoniobacterales bacterium]
MQSPQPSGFKASSGAALIIVLTFVVLLAGLIVAFFSRSILDRQISNSSATQAKVELLAQGAAAQIIADLKTEIAAGSTITTPAPGVNIYSPKASLSTVPALVGSTGTGGLENLVKRSAYNQPFYPTTGYDANGSKRAANVSSTLPSQNGRFISAARWNKPLLLPTTSGTNLVPSAAGYTAPDWVLVARDGTNPTTWNTNLIATSATTTSAVAGRYAYQIYDEGALLDANVAGSPVNDGTAQPVGTIAPYKSALAYADLTQIPGLSTLPVADQAKVINALVGWRNYASGQAAGTFPSYTSFGTATAPSTLTPFDLSVLGNTNGFLQAANTSLTNGQSDRLFTSRQQLIKLLLAIGNTVTTFTPALQLQTLQYLGTFSRDVNQPSFVRTQSMDASGLGYDSGAPKIAAVASGGNNATGLDAAINPSFPAVRVKAAFARNDGSQAVVGEPLVKKRFALNRLAWLTCKGSSQPRASSSDADIVALKATGITQAWLEQGTDANILKYFGLKWNAGLWEYQHGRDTARGPIKKLTYPTDGAGKDVVTSNREPNFFELLKAAINVGSIGKTLTAPGAGDVTFQSQYNTDVSVDASLIRMGANIMDQFDTDGYPTRISFDDGSGSKEYVGVENLPYIYRVRNGLIKIAEPKVSDGGSPYQNWYWDSRTITDTGVGALMQYVDIWNPHDYSTTNLSQTMGAEGPSDQTGPQFRMVATSAAAAGVAVWAVPYTSYNVASTEQAASPGYNTMYGFPWSSEPRSLTEANTEMTFQIGRNATGAGLFREPTILFQPGKPTGSNLTATAISNKDSGLLGIVANTAGFFANGGLRSAVDTTDGTGLPVKETGYIGIYFGCHPLQWKISGSVTRCPGQQSILIGSSGYMTYKLQCKGPDGSWVTYDQKLMNPGTWDTLNQSLMGTSEACFLLPKVGAGNFAMSVDPRSGRFGMMHGWASDEAYFIPPFHAEFNNGTYPNRSGWLNKAEGIVISNRNGYAGGGPVPANKAGWAPTSAMGWFPGNWDPAGDGSEPMFRPGIFAQNDPSYLTARSVSDQTGYGSDPTPPRAGVGTLATYYSDPDGVVRRASAAYVNGTQYVSTAINKASPAPGQPMATANDDGTTRTSQSDSRPIVLNRPFRTVSELGYVFSGTPWKNLNFFTPESGDTALLDVFSIQDTGNTDALVAGKVNLNTRQWPVLQAIIAGAYKDERTMTTIAGGAAAEAGNIAGKLVARTTGLTTNGQAPSPSTAQPLQNPGELVGKWKTGSSKTLPATGTKTAYDASVAYDGFSADLSSVLTTGADTTVQRYREAAMRALSSSGQTRVWNLMIDVVAQTGRYPQSATALDKFVVEGEQRYWVHVAIDRSTGQVIDKQIEVVKE